MKICSKYFKTPQGRSVQKRYAQTCTRRRERKLNLDARFTKENAQLVGVLA